jgi:predicted HTH domain antitoxin
MEVVLKIPEEVIEAVKLPHQEIEPEFRKELILALYQRGALALGKARSLAQMTRWEFEDLWWRRQITRHYTDMAAEEDIQHGLGRL